MDVEECYLSHMGYQDVLMALMAGGETRDEVVKGAGEVGAAVVGEEWWWWEGCVCEWIEEQALGGTCLYLLSNMF